MSVSPVTLKKGDEGDLRTAVVSSAFVAAPAAPALATATTGGKIAALTAYFYRITALSGAGETTVGPNASITTGAAGNTHSNTLTITAVTGARAYGIYRGTTSGSETFLGFSTATTYIDRGYAVTGAQPTANRAGLTAQVAVSRPTRYWLIRPTDANAEYAVLFGAGTTSPDLFMGIFDKGEEQFASYCKGEQEFELENEVLTAHVAACGGANVEFVISAGSTP